MREKFTKNKPERAAGKPPERVKKMDKYIERIEKAQTLEELDAVVESAAWDDDLTASQYCEIYAKALKKAQE